MDKWELDIGEVCKKQGREGNIKGRAGGGGFVKSVKGIIGKLRSMGLGGIPFLFLFLFFSISLFQFFFVLSL